MILRIDSFVRRVSRYAAISGGVLILLASLLVFADVMARYFIGWTVGGADELSGYALAIGTAWALPYCLLWRANIRVDSLYRIMPTKVRVVLDVFGLSVLGAFALLLTYRAGMVLIETIEMGSISVTPLSIPLVIPQSIWVAGLCWYVCAFAIVFVRVGLALFKWDTEGVFKVAGSGGGSEANEQSVT